MCMWLREYFCFLAHFTDRLLAIQQVFGDGCPLLECVEIMLRASRVRMCVFLLLIACL